MFCRASNEIRSESRFCQTSKSKSHPYLMLKLIVQSVRKTPSLVRHPILQGGQGKFSNWPMKSNDLYSIGIAGADSFSQCPNFGRSARLLPRSPTPIPEKIAARFGSKMSPSLSIEALLYSRALALHCYGKMMEYYTVRTCAMHAVSPFCTFARFVVCTMLHVCKRTKEFLSNNVKATPRCSCAFRSTYESQHARDCIQSHFQAVCLLDINLLNAR